MQFVDDFCCPLVGLLTSEAVNEVASKNGLNFGDLLLPFCCCQISIKDPLGQMATHKLRLDIRDIRRKGFLLENTVFRFVLQENILEHCAEAGYKYDGQSILSKTFFSTFLHWLEPAEHEFLRAYLGCIFMASTSESDPLKSFEELEIEQRQEQHGTDGKRISPAYCSVPKWFFHQSLFKYYVLVHDNSNEIDQERSKQLFESMCSRYGQSNCHLLSVNSTNPVKSAIDVMPDLWTPILARNHRGLKAGIDLAKKNLLAPSKSASSSNLASNGPLNSAQQRPEISPSVLPVPGISSTTLSSQLFLADPLSSNQFDAVNGSISEHQFQHPLSYAQIVEGTSDQPMNRTKTSITKQMSSSGIPTYGQWLDVKDRQRLREMVEALVTKALVPFVERQLSELNEIVANRKSLAKSTFSNMRKWLGATANAVSALNADQQQASAVSYGSETIEAQMRRMADLAFLFGLYNFSYQFYQSLKKEFANEQAWMYHAGALEMAALASFLNDWRQFSDHPTDSTPSKITLAVLRKQYPQRYMDNAINYYANVCRVPMLALRSLMISSQILAQLELFEDAAQQMISVGVSLQLNSELFDAVLLEHAARLYSRSGKRRRKMSFYLTTAAIRISRFLERTSSQQQQQRNSPPIIRAMNKIDEKDDERLRDVARRNLLRNLYEEILQTSTIADKGWRWAEDYLLCLYMDCF